MFLGSWTRFVRDLRAEVVRDPPSHKNVIFDLCCFVPFHEKYGHESGSLQSRGISQLIAFLGQEHLIPVSILRSPLPQARPAHQAINAGLPGKTCRAPITRDALVSSRSKARSLQFTSHSQFIISPCNSFRSLYIPR